MAEKEGEDSRAYLIVDNNVSAATQSEGLARYN